MFLAFLLRLLGGAAIPLFLLSVLSTPVFAVDPLSLPIRDKKENPPALAYTLMGTRLAIQVYVWLGWAAYCTALTLRYTSQLSVTNPIAFYVVAFIAVNVPIAFLAVKESAVVENDRERQRLRRGTALYRGITIVGFVGFCMLPELMRAPYGWLVESIVPTDEKIEISELLRHAEMGDAAAQHQLGVAYSEGRLLPLDPKEAERWYLAAANQEHRGSQSELCAIYVASGTREGGPALRWCSAAAEQGDPKASFYLASLYVAGPNVDLNRKETNRLYQTAAQGGVAEAQIIIGLDYADDDNLPVDFVQAYRWLTLASSATTAGQDLTDIISLRESVRTRLSTEQLAEARRMVLEWQPTAGN